MLLSFPCLHDSDNNSINDVLSFHANLLVISLLCSLVLLIFLLLLLVSLRGSVCHLDVRILEVLRHTDLFTILECRSLHVLFVEDFLFRVAEPHKCLLSVTLGDPCHLFDLQVGKILVFVEQKHNDRLVAVHHEDVGLRSDKHRLHLDATVVQEPRQVAVRVLLLVKTFELDRDVLDLRGEGASCLLLVRPVTIGQHFCTEVYSHLRNLVSLLSLFEFVNKIFRQVNIIEHRSKLVYCIVTAFNFQF